MKISAKNEAKEEIKQFEIQYEKPKIILTPEIKLLYPKSVVSKSSLNTTYVEVQIKNVKSQNNVILKVNDIDVKIPPDASSENGLLNLVWGKVEINEGTNNVKIIAKNESLEATNVSRLYIRNSCHRY